MGIRGIFLAIEAGGCAAMASVSAKLATSSESATELATPIHYFIEYYYQAQFLTLHEVTLALRLLSVCGIFLFNALMWLLFTKSMHECSSTLEATAFNLSSNFIMTAVVGKLLFGEQLNSLWYIGSLLIIVGLTVIHSASDNATTQIKTSEVITNVFEFLSLMQQLTMK
ncbi:hypothetical protein Btru_050392 [Bulinus truncatus]|nr:hypothetical protein Btru_050392 [Bulinus truncatus]